MNAHEEQPRPMGTQGQEPLRACERSVRRGAVAFAHWNALGKMNAGQAAAKLGLKPATLRAWQRRWPENALRSPSLGRPGHPIDPPTRQDVIEVLEEIGPAVGVPTLKEIFPQVARSQLAAICHDYRQQLHREHLAELCHLSWFPCGVGKIWAADFTEFPAPIDGCYPYGLFVRDLPSSFQILALPTLTADSSVVVAALAGLFNLYGPALVMKADRGSPFIAEHTGMLLIEHGVTPLLSPPRTPQYNGACEAGIGSMKTRAHHAAARHGRLGFWTCDDLETGRQEANATARPWGIHGPTPQEVWQQRTPISADERGTFLQRVEDIQQSIMRARGLRPEPAPNRAARAVVARAAVRRALESLGYLFVQRGPISPPLTVKTCEFIT